MINIKTFMELINYRITEGSECYTNIPNLYSFTFWNGNHNGCSANIIFSTKDQTVYAVEVCDYKNNCAYRMIDSRLDNDKEAWEGVNFIDLEVDEDFIDKAQSIIAGITYNTKVSTIVKLENNELFQLTKMANEQDITLNNMIEEIIKIIIRDHNKIKDITDAFNLIKSSN
jgi:hypothetical protein